MLGSGFRLHKLLGLFIAGPSKLGSDIRSEVAKWDTLMEHVIDLLESLAFTFGDEKVREDEAEGRNGAKNETDLRLQAGVLVINKVGDREVHSKAERSKLATISSFFFQIV